MQGRGGGEYGPAILVHVSLSSVPLPSSVSSASALWSLFPFLPCSQLLAAAFGGAVLVVAMVIAILFSSPSLSPIVAIPGALVVLWSGLVQPGLRRCFMVVSVHPLHPASSHSQQ